MHDVELRSLSNIVHRAMTLCSRYCQDRLPDVDVMGPFPFDVKDLRRKVEDCMREFRVASAAGALVEATTATDEWLLRIEPWKLEDAQRQPLLRVLLEAVFVLAHLHAPFTPTIADAIACKFSSGLRPLGELKDFVNLEPGCAIASKSVLLKPLELDGGAASSNNPEKAAVASIQANAPRKDVAEDTQAGSKTRANTTAVELDPISKMQFESSSKLWEPEVCPAGRSIPEGMDLYLAERWAPGILVRPSRDGSMGDHLMVDERCDYNDMLVRILPGEQCLDIGGHVGALTAALSEAAPGVRVVAVEPDPDSASVFRANLEWRRLEHVTFLEAALRARGDASTTLYRATHNASVNSCVPVQGRDSIQVSVVTVADVLRACDSPPTVAKMDIEGGEYEVLPILLAACPELRLLSLELHLTKRVFQAHLGPALTELLELFGFRPLGGRRPELQGVLALTHWEREPGMPRVAPELLPALLALWRHAHMGCTEQLAARAGGP